MTKNELKGFTAILRAKQTALESASHNRGAMRIDVSADEMDRIQHSQERELAIGTLDRGAKLLQQVRAALSRIDMGTFGLCVDCDEPIGIARLAAVPWAMACISCQEASEESQKALQTTPGQIAVGVDV